MNKVGWSFKSFKTLLVVASITFPILLTLTLVHQNNNSVSDLFQGFHVLSGRTLNTNATAILSKDHDIIRESTLGKFNSSFFIFIMQNTQRITFNITISVYL